MVCPNATGCWAVLNSTAMRDDLTYLFVYADQVTGGLATPLICASFFLVVFLGSLAIQWRSTGTMKVDTSLLAASFVTIGFELILMQKGLVNGAIFGVTIALALLSFWWVAVHDSETPGI